MDNGESKSGDFTIEKNGVVIGPDLGKATISDSTVTNNAENDKKGGIDTRGSAFISRTGGRFEFDNVIILDANQGITPSSKAETEEKIEEERRMFYVAATRAKKKLYIFSIGRRNNANMYPSCFVREFLPE